MLLREAGGHASEETSRSLERGGENTLLFWAQERRFIALRETGWRQKSGARPGASLARPWGWWMSGGGKGFMGLSLHLKLL